METGQTHGGAAYLIVTMSVRSCTTGKNLHKGGKNMSEPRGSSEEDSKRIKALKKRVHDLYANYREGYKKAKS